MGVESMNLFEAIPANLFSIFNSKNREIYVTTLFALRQSFKQELSIEKELLIQQLANSLHQELLNLLYHTLFQVRWDYHFQTV